MSILIWVVSLSSALQDEQEILRQIDRLGSEKSDVRSEAEAVLRKAGKKALSHLLHTLRADTAGMQEKVAAFVKRLSNPDWKQRDRAMKDLRRLGRRALPLLRAYEEGKNPEVAWRVRTVVAEIREGTREEVRREKARNRGIVFLLGYLDDRRAVPPLMRVLADSDSALRIASAKSLARLRPYLTKDQAEEATDRVLDLFPERKDALEKSLLIRVLGDLGSAACVKPISQLLLDKSERNVNLKSNAISTLVRIRRPRGMRAVIEMLLAEDVYLRFGAHTQLRRIVGESFGYLPRGTLAQNRAAVDRYRRWWEKQFGLSWKS